ncbi:MAG: hypothetical protein WC227_00670 [Patescibacteria group bacterium]|jgi:hypothetical protein
MHKKQSAFIFSSFAMVSAGILLVPAKAFAICQVVCPIVVASTLTLLEKYGIDNTISGLWIGGALLLSSIITIDWIKKWKSHWSINLAVFTLFYAGTFLPLYFKHIIGDPTKVLWGMDKTLLGVVVGSIFFYLGDWAYRIIKAKNGGKAWFPFQKAVMPLIPIAIFSWIFYLITK